MVFFYCSYYKLHHTMQNIRILAHKRHLITRIFIKEHIRLVKGVIIRNMFIFLV
jgi:hypothetical protein